MPVTIQWGQEPQKLAERITASKETAMSKDTTYQDITAALGEVITSPVAGAIWVIGRTESGECFVSERWPGEGGWTSIYDSFMDCLGGVAHRIEPGDDMPDTSRFRAYDSDIEDVFPKGHVQGILTEVEQKIKRLDHRVKHLEQLQRITQESQGKSNATFAQVLNELRGDVAELKDRLTDDAPDPRLDGPIGDAYARYDSDPRVNGLNDFAAFADAVESFVSLSKRVPNIVNVDVPWEDRERK